MPSFKDFKLNSLNLLASRHPEWTDEDLSAADKQLDEIYKQYNLSRPETQKQELNTYGTSDAIKAAGEAALKTGTAAIKDIIPATTKLATGVGGFATDVASGLAQEATGLISPSVAEEIKYAGQGVKQKLENINEAVDYLVKDKTPQLEQDENYVAKAQKVREEFKNPSKQEPTWFKNFQKNIEESPGSEELFNSLKGLINMPIEAGKNITDTAATLATGEGYFNKSFAEDAAEAPAETILNTLIGAGIPLALAPKGVKKILKQPIEKTYVEPEAKTLRGYDITKEGEVKALTPEEALAQEQLTQSLNQDLINNINQGRPIRPTTEIIQGVGEPVISPTSAAEVEIANRKANELQAKMGKAYLEAQMADQAKTYRQQRQAELEQTLGPTQIYENLFKEIEQNKIRNAELVGEPIAISPEEMAQFVLPEVTSPIEPITPKTRLISDMLKSGRAEIGIKRPNILDEQQQGMTISGSKTPEKIFTNPLLKYKNIPEFNLDVIDYKKSAENILSQIKEQPLLLTNGTNIATVLPSVKEKGKFQFTAFDERGPIRDITKNSKQELIEEALKDGYENFATQEQFNNLTSKTSFLNFMKAGKKIEEKQNQLQPQQEPLANTEQPNIPFEQQPAAREPKNNVSNLLQKGKEFIQAEEGSLNLQPITNMLQSIFGKQTKTNTPFETDTTLKPINDKLTPGFEEYNRQLTERTKKAAESKPGAWERFMTEVVNKAYPIVKRGEKVGDINPKIYADDINYLPTTQQGYLEVVNPKALNIDKTAFGQFLALWRTATERKQIKNFISVPEAEQTLQYLQTKHPDFYNQMVQAKDNFFNARSEWIIQELAKSKLFTPELIQHIATNPDYSTNAIVKYLGEQRAGNKATGALAKIFKQVGSEEAIGNPYENTVLKDLALLQAARTNKFKVASIDMLLNNYSNLIKPADKKVVGETFEHTDATGQKVKEPIIEYLPPKEAGYDTVFLKRDGKTEAYYMPRHIADSINLEPASRMVWSEALNNINNAFKGVWIRYNYKFWAPAFAKDVMDTAIFMPTFKGKAKYLSLLVPRIINSLSSIYGLPETAKRTLGQYMDLETKRFYQEGSVMPERRMSAYSNFELDPLDRIMQSFDIDFGGEKQGLFKGLKKGIDAYASLGSILERANKMAAADALRTVKIKGKVLTPEEVRYYARRLGSPAFLQGGRGTRQLQAIFPFINPIVQGIDAAYNLAKADPIGSAASLGALSFLAAWQIAARKGVLGDDMQKQYRSLSDNEMDNFFNIPGTDLKVPLGFMFKPINKTLNSIFEGSQETLPTFLLSVMSDTMLDELPTVTPVGKMALDMSAIANGLRVYDYYRGYYPIDKDQEMQRQALLDKGKMYLKYFWNNYFGGSLYKFNLNLKPGKEYTAQQTFNPLQRFIRTEQEKEGAEIQREQKAIQEGEKDIATQRWGTKLMMRGQPTPEDLIPQKSVIKSEVLNEALKDVSPETKFFMRIRNERPEVRGLLIKKYLEEKGKNW